MLTELLSEKLDRTKFAAQAYIRDRAVQGGSVVTSYAIGVGLYAAAGIFGIAMLLVSATAGFRWIEINYGLFPAFGATGGFLLAVTVLCAVLASRSMNRPAKSIIPLSSRLRVAVNATSSSARTSSVAAFRKLPRASLPQSGSSVMVGLVIASSLIGWALSRRFSESRVARNGSPKRS